MRSIIAALAVALLLTSAPAPALAQMAPADSAAVLLDAARTFTARGAHRNAEAVLRLIIERFPGTPAAEAARAELAPAVREQERGTGRTGFVVFNTLYGAWLGTAVPAAFDSDSPGAYGAGLLIGAPLGFFASKAYADAKQISPGQSGLISFATAWGTWQGMGWQDVLNIGDREFCESDYCYRDESATAPYVAGIIGGLTGLGVGLLAARNDVPSGTSSLIFNSSLWGSWYGLATAVLLDGDDDGDALPAVLIGGNVGVLGAIPLAKAWRPTPSQVRLTSIAGFAGGMAGLGLDLIFEVDSDDAAVLIPTVTATAGLLAGALLTRNRDRDRVAMEGAGPTFGSLVNLDGRARLGIPMPLPTMVRGTDALGRTTRKPGLMVSLVSGQF